MHAAAENPDKTNIENAGAGPRARVRTLARGGGVAWICLSRRSSNSKLSLKVVSRSAKVADGRKAAPADKGKAKRSCGAGTAVQGRHRGQKQMPE